MNIMRSSYAHDMHSGRSVYKGVEQLLRLDTDSETGCETLGHLGRDAGLTPARPVAQTSVLATGTVVVVTDTSIGLCSGLKAGTARVGGPDVTCRFHPEY